jgi:HD-like signal output (HDOD) protein
MNTEFMKKLTEQAGELASLPQTLVEVLRVVRDEHSSSDQLARALMKDPPLTARLLRMSNSPIFGTGQKIGSMIQAIRMLGVRQVVALALSTTVYDMTSGWQSSFDRMRFWRHSLETAIATRLIGEELGRKPLDELFITGLLHDLGLLLLETGDAAEFSRVWNAAETDSDLVQLEREAWGCDHAEVGAELLQQWNLPESIYVPVRNHHNTGIIGKQDPEYIVAQILMLGHLITKFTIAPERMLTTETLLAKETLRLALELPSERLMNIEKELTSVTLTEAAYLEINVGTVDDLLLEAHRLLFEQCVQTGQLANENRRLKEQMREMQTGTAVVT